MRHEEISHGMFPNYPINSITNGVHAATWTSSPLAALYDKHIPEWRKDNLYLRYCVSLPVGEILKAHSEAKQLLFEEINPGIIKKGKIVYDVPEGIKVANIKISTPGHISSRGLLAQCFLRPGFYRCWVFVPVTSGNR